MTAYIYVLAIWNRKDEMLRFEHKIVLTGSEENAYRLGAREAEVAKWLPITNPDESANDYVIRLVED